MSSSPRLEFIEGAIDTIPLMIGAIPFGIIYGTLSQSSDLSIYGALALSSIVFAGSSQFVALGHTNLINPALMDFGAAVCTGRPKCESCPVSHICKALTKFRSGQVPKPQRRNKIYAGSDREWRGKILEILRQYSRPVSEKKIKKILNLESEEQTERLLAGLEKDLLISREKHLVRLG